jgi:hypothetical protein
MNKTKDPSISNLAAHFAWKERVKKEQNSVYNSLHKCVSMGILQKLPLKDEEVAGLTPTEQKDPFRLLKKLKESLNNEVYSPYAMNSTLDKSPTDGFENKRYSDKDCDSPQKIVFPKIKARLSSNESVPYSEFLIGSQSTVTKEAPILNYKTMDNSYKPQKKQFNGDEKMKYMMGTINLKQPKFTYLPFKKQNQKTGFSTMKPSAGNTYYTREYDAFIDKVRSRREKLWPNHDKLLQDSSLENEAEEVAPLELSPLLDEQKRSESHPRVNNELMQQSPGELMRITL